MAFDRAAARQLLEDCNLHALFVELLGWDRVQGSYRVQTPSGSFDVARLAQKRSFQVLVVSPDADGRIPPSAVRAEIAVRTTAVAREHFLIYVDAAGTQLLWAPPRGQHDASSHRYFVSGITSGLLDLIGRLVFEFSEEDWLTLSIVQERVRNAFRTDRRAYLSAHFAALQDAEREAGLVSAPDGRDEFYSEGFIAYSEQYRRFSLLQARDEVRLGRAIASGDRPAAKAAWSELVAANLRLVVNIARRYRNRGLELLDLVQHGNLGLMRAARRFDPERGTKFSTYATSWIKQSITRALADEGRTIRLPVHAVDHLNLIRRGLLSFAATQGRDPTFTELEAVLAHMYAGRTDFEAAAFSGERLRDFLLATQASTSLDSLGLPRDPFEGTYDPEHEPDELDWTDEGTFEAPEAHAAHALLAYQVAGVMATLTGREARVLDLRFGLSDGRSRTLEEVGQEFGVTRERIRQIEAKALKKIRHPSRAKKLRDFVLPDAPRDSRRDEQRAPGWHRSQYGATWWPCTCFAHGDAEEAAAARCPHGPSLPPPARWGGRNKAGVRLATPRRSSAAPSTHTDPPAVEPSPKSRRMDEPLPTSNPSGVASVDEPPGPDLGPTAVPHVADLRELADTVDLSRHSRYWVAQKPTRAQQLRAAASRSGSAHRRQVVQDQEGLARAD